MIPPVIVAPYYVASAPKWGWEDAPVGEVLRTTALRLVGHLVVAWNEKQVFQDHVFDLLQQSIGTAGATAGAGPPVRQRPSAPPTGLRRPERAGPALHRPAPAHRQHLVWRRLPLGLEPRGDGGVRLDGRAALTAPAAHPWP